MVSNPFGTGVTGSGEPSNGNSDPLQVQYVLLTAWQSLQPLTFSFLMPAIKSTSYRYGSPPPHYSLLLWNILLLCNASWGWDHISW